MPSVVPERVRWAVAQVVLRPSDRVLEVGCGPGHAVALLCGQREHRDVTAIDRSALQVARARTRNRVWVEKGAARLHHLALEDAPRALGEARFDALLAVNVNVYWTSASTALPASADLLVSRGRAYLVYEPPSAARSRSIEKLLTALLPAHGFRVEDIRTTAFRKGHGLCIIGRPNGFRHSDSFSHTE